MSWHFLQEQVAESWAHFCLDGAPDALLRLMPTVELHFSRANGTESLNLSRSGMTCAHSTDARGAGQSMSYQVDSLVKTSVQQALGGGLDGERSGLWMEMARIIREVEPEFAWLENSPVITSRGLGRILGDLASMGFDARWGVFSAGDAGARHERSRFFCLAYRRGLLGSPRPWSEQQFRQPASEPFCNGKDAADSEALWLAMADARAGMDDDVARRVVRTHAIGNGQVPCVVAGAWRMLSGE